MNSDSFLTNYRLLVNGLDDHARRIAADYGAHMSCGKGCDGCCQHLSLFWVEGFALFDALRKSPKPKADSIRCKAALAGSGLQCPLLEGHACLLYEARPIICRTHGLPLMHEENGSREVHYCPENFRDLKALPGTAVLDMEVVNASLATINALFVAEFFPPGSRPSGERHKLSAFLSGPAEQCFIDRIGTETR